MNIFLIINILIIITITIIIIIIIIISNMTKMKTQPRQVRWCHFIVGDVDTYCMIDQLDVQ